VDATARAELIARHPALAEIFDDARAMREEVRGDVHNWRPTRRQQYRLLDDLWLGRFEYGGLSHKLRKLFRTSAHVLSPDVTIYKYDADLLLAERLVRAELFAGLEMPNRIGRRIPAARQSRAARRLKSIEVARQRRLRHNEQARLRRHQLRYLHGTAEQEDVTRT
jgi:hypothetical protein